MPGEVSKVVFDATTKMVHVLGQDAGRLGRDGLRRRAPLRNATYADARCRSPACPGRSTPPTTTRARTGRRSWSPRPTATIASIDVGGDPFAWRFPGVIAGALTAAVLIYLLARILFKRRSIAILAGILVAVDGMFFVQSRIAMNDVYCRAVHRRRLHPVRRGLDGLVALALGVARGACRSSGSCSAWPWPASGSGCTRSPGSGS